MRNPDFLKQTLAKPKQPESIPKNVQWLAGEGAGSWFYIERKSGSDYFKIKRFSPKGKLECEGIFEIESPELSLNLDQPYQFIHLSHCAFVHIEQGGKVLKLIRKID